MKRLYSMIEDFIKCESTERNLPITEIVNMFFKKQGFSKVTENYDRYLDEIGIATVFETLCLNDIKLSELTVSAIFNALCYLIAQDVETELVE